MNKKRKEEIANLVKQGKSSKEAYEATKKSSSKTAKNNEEKKTKVAAKKEK